MDGVATSEISSVPRHRTHRERCSAATSLQVQTPAAVGSHQTLQHDALLDETELELKADGVEPPASTTLNNSPLLPPVIPTETTALFGDDDKISLVSRTSASHRSSTWTSLHWYFPLAMTVHSRMYWAPSALPLPPKPASHLHEGFHGPWCPLFQTCGSMLASWQHH